MLLQLDKLRRLHAELEEKLEAAEIQNKQQSAAYRAQLQQKDVSHELRSYRFRSWRLDLKLEAPLEVKLKMDPFQQHRLNLTLSRRWRSAT